MAILNLSTPWVEYYRKIDAFFKQDDEVTVIYNEGEREIKLYVDNAKKANALTELLPTEKTYGNVTVTLTIVPGNLLKSSKAVVFKDAFEGNKAVSYMHTISGIFENEITYIVFVPKVVQYFADDLGDINGLHSTLYQDLAADIFEDRPGIFFCTDKIDNLGCITIKASDYKL